MPEFTVIDGGGDRGIKGFSGRYAVRCFEDLVIELLRDVARDQQSTGRVTELIFSFTDAAAAYAGPLSETIEPAMQKLNGRAFQEHRPGPDQELQDIVQSGLRVAAESMATDGASGARLSRREGEMRAAIDGLIEGKETRSRENGWSYLGEMSRKLGKWTPPPRAASQKLKFKK